MDAFSTLSLSVAHIEEAFGARNMYYTWVAIGRPHRSPTVGEAIRHYISHARPYTVRFIEVHDETCATQEPFLPFMQTTLEHDALPRRGMDAP